jgi:hypothetical protein
MDLNSKPHGAARQQATAKWSAYQILSVIFLIYLMLFNNLLKILKESN